jgi:2-amino-4-hydroxy-6-hydroxymethyldihydropteridine diphosphokinase
MSPVRAYVALGSNLGDREMNLVLAREQLGRTPGIEIRGVSSVEETAPLGLLAQPAYLNQMLALDTGLSPRQLLEQCHRIETLAGRERRTRWESRTLDLDIVGYGGLSIQEPGLTLPHPGLPDREFWQRELAELERLGL